MPNEATATATAAMNKKYPAPPSVDDEDLFDENSKTISSAASQDNPTTEDIEAPSKTVNVSKSVNNNNSNRNYENQDQDVNTGHEETYEDENGSFGLMLVSYIFFLIGSIFYVWLAVYGFYYEWEIVDIPDEVVEADDDASWQPYIDAGTYTDDYVFPVGGDEDDEDTYWVSAYQMIYFAAAICFVFTGIFDFCRSPGFFAVIFTIAGLFGVASAMLVEWDEYLSNIMNSVSVHLFLGEAIALLIYQDLSTGWLYYYTRFGYLMFVGGTVTDVILSYFGIIADYDLRHSKVEIAAACMWLVSAIILLSGFTIMRSNSNNANLISSNQSYNEKKLDTPSSEEEDEEMEGRTNVQPVTSPAVEDKEEFA